MAFYDIFNEKTEEFLKELSTSFPDIVQFSHFKTGFMFLKSFDRKQPQSIFNTYVYVPYKDKILAQDEGFFLTNDYDIQSDSKESWVQFIDNIRAVWTGLSDANKDVIWKYFKVLVVLNEKCLTST